MFFSVRINKFLLFVLFFVLSCFVCGKTSFASKHTECVDKLLNNVLASMEKQKTQKEKRQVVINEYMQVINFEWNAKMALGRPYKTLNEKEQSEYVREYTKFLAYTWLPKMNYDRSLNLKFIVKKETEKLGKEDEKVCVEIVSPDARKYDIFLRVRYDKEKNTCQLLNIDVEGVDLALSYRSQFEAYIEEHEGKANSVISFLKNANDVNKTKVDFVLPKVL